MPEPPVSDQPRHVNPWIVAVAVMFATFMEVLDTTVVNVSLPHIASSMAATTEEATWALTSYLVANAIILPMTGWLAARFGRKNLLMAATAGFTISSFLCGIAPSLATLVIFRILQGATGGVLQPLSQAVLLESFAPEERGRAMGFWGLGIVVAPILGPVVGGWLTENYTWRWVFYINLPVGVASLIMTRLYVFDPPYLQRESSGIDYWGMGLLVVGVGTLQYVLDKGQQDDWFESTTIATLSIVAAAALIVLVIQQLRSKNPIIDLRIFANRSYAVGVFLMTVLGFVLYGSLVLLPVMLQTLYNYSSLEAGKAMAPRGIGSLLMMPLVGYLTGVFDARKLLVAGLAVGGFTLLWLGEINLNAGFWDIAWPQVFQGAGLALLFVPLTTVSMADVSPMRMGYATSLFNLMRNIGGSVGIAITATMLQRQRQAIAARLGEQITPYDPVTQSTFEQIRAGLAAAGADLVTATERTYVVMHGLLIREASMVSFVALFRTLGIVFLLMIPLVALMRRPKGRGAVAGGH